MSSCDMLIAGIIHDKWENSKSLFTSQTSRKKLEINRGSGVRLDHNLIVPTNPNLSQSNADLRKLSQFLTGKYDLLYRTHIDFPRYELRTFKKRTPNYHGSFCKRVVLIGFTQGLSRFLILSFLDHVEEFSIQFVI